MRTGFLAVIISIAFAQTGFEVASIKPSAPGQRGFSIVPSPGGRLTMKNCTLKRLLAAAYHVQDFQVSGGPKWMDSDPWDIVAKAEGSPNLTEHQLLELLRPVLADRFQTAFHWETKQQPRYLLVAGKGGSKLTEVKADGGPEVNIRSRKMITGRRAPVSQLVETLSWVLGRAVVDQTGLAGVYDFKLDWAPDELQLTEPGSGGTAGAEPGSSLLAAIQEQLGLKLEPQKGPVEILVVDRAEKAASN
ncbi:MAG TPA: TIGR03435 family protein [Bryobacteraceae bacterium]|jgi:uncharacterized protein (TIGR03435 family)|nr:TIGR03435 family protein [Bryobacteraceae bacterium]